MALHFLKIIEEIPITIYYSTPLYHVSETHFMKKDTKKKLPFLYYYNF